MLSHTGEEEEVAVQLFPFFYFSIFLFFCHEILGNFFALHFSFLLSKKAPRKALLGSKKGHR